MVTWFPHQNLNPPKQTPTLSPAAYREILPQDVRRVRSSRDPYLGDARKIWVVWRWFFGGFWCFISCIDVYFFVFLCGFLWGLVKSEENQDNKTGLGQSVSTPKEPQQGKRLCGSTASTAGSKTVSAVSTSSQRGLGP